MKKIFDKKLLKTFLFVLPYILVEFTNTLLVTIDKSMSNSINTIQTCVSSAPYDSFS